MVSFFGLRVGGKKKKSDDKPASQEKPQQQQQWKRIDQNALGEGQYFGRNVNKQPVFEACSVRTVSRPGTPHLAPYARPDSHNLGAVSMVDLSSSAAITGRPGTSAGFGLRPHASEANMRARFGAYNGSSTSLAAPGPGFGARFAARNGSAASLALPVAPFGSRPGTPNRTKPWVNPMDVYFGINTTTTAPPAGPQTPKSPLIDSPKLPPTPTTPNADSRSVFGEDADDMVNSVMASVKKKEEEEREAKRREAELEKQRETARLEMERLERQKSTESSLSGRRPSAPAQPEPEPEPVSLDIPPSLIRSEAEPKEGQRASPPQHHAIHQGPPPTGPPTGSLPQPPGQNPPRNGPLGPPARSYTSPSPSNSRAAGPSAANAGTQKVFKPYRPPPLQSCGPLGPLPDRFRSPSPTLKGPGLAVMAHSPALPQSPTLHSPPLMEHRPVVTSPEPETPKSPRSPTTPAPEKSEPGPLLSSLTSPSTLTSPTGSIRRLSLDEEQTEQAPRPIIQNVRAKRDTLALSAARNHSLSMKIEELEKTLLKAQIEDLRQPRDMSEAERTSTSSSVYSNGQKAPGDEEDDDEGPILSSIQPLRVPHPAPAPSSVAPASQPAPPITSAPRVASPGPGSRPQSPMRGPPRRGPLPRRPALDEYGISANQVVRGRGTPTPSSRSGSVDNYSTHSSPPSRTNTPQLRPLQQQPPQPSWKRDLNQPSPAPAVENGSDSQQSQGRLNPAVDTGFNFDFGPGPNLSMAPPTPDSTNWPLPSPSTGAGETASAAPASDPSSRASPKPSDAPAKFTRANVPPPLNIDLTKFNFNPDAPSRDPALGGLWTPPFRPVPWASTTADGRPSTSSGASGPGSLGNGSTNGGGKLAASPRLVSQFPESARDDGGAFMGIGMARGPSIREVQRPKTSGGPPRRPGRSPAPPPAQGPAMVDSFGTGFI